MLFSGELGVAKPDPDVCSVLAEQSGARPADCLFLDDRQENVDSARRAGLRAEHWSGTGAGRTGRNPLPGVLGTVPVPSRRTPYQPPER
ncbi:HAD-IA family hydrolase [Streptomyces sp. S1D4-11]